jgi:hypothetical protein
MLRKEIRVHPACDSIACDLIIALERLLPVQFRSCSSLDECRKGDFVISLSGVPRVLDQLSKRKVHFFHVRSSTTAPRSETDGEPVQFANSPNIDKVLRGRRIPHRALPNLPVGRSAADEEILASYGSIPLWVRRANDEWSGYMVNLPLPTLTVAEKPFDYLNGYHFMQLLPLLHFLRKATAEMGWTPPPIRACFMFDDPNLHWPSYGCLSYAKVLERARAERFHVSVSCCVCHRAARRLLEFSLTSGQAVCRKPTAPVAVISWQRSHSSGTWPTAHARRVPSVVGAEPPSD